MATIRTAADKITAQVTGFSQVKQSQFNDSCFQSVLFEGEGLPDGKIWRSMTPEQAQGFTRGEQVFLVPTTNKHGKPSYDIELITPAAPQVPTTAPATAPAPAAGHQPPANARAAYMETLERVGNRYAACMAKAKQVWLTQYSEEELKALPELISSTTATLFIECSKLTR